MAALLSPRSALVARSPSISAGAIVGATIGSVIGALLIVLCFLPFILRARRRRAFRRQHGDAAGTEDVGQLPGAPDFLPRSHFSDAFRRLSRDRAPDAPAKTYGAGEGEESTQPNPEPNEKPQTTLYPIGVSVQNGLPSPISPPLPAVTRLEQLPGRSIRDGRTATGSLTLATQTTQDSIPPQMLSRELTMTEAGTTSMKQSMTDSFASPSRQGTFGSQDITQEPESFAQGRKSQSRRRSSHISESLRQLAHRASAAVRRGSTMSTGSIRSPTSATGGDLPPAASAPAAFEPIDTEAPGEAYSYYHGFDAVPQSTPAAVPEQPAIYGPPISIPTTSAPPLTIPTFTSPTSVSTVTPISPVSPVRPSSQIPPLGSRATPGHDGSDEPYSAMEGSSGPSLLDRRGRFEGPKRMDTQPLRPIVSDIPSPPLPSKADHSVNPMDIWGPTNKEEKDWMVRQELVKITTPSPPTRSETTPPLDDFPSQPTPDQTPEPEVDSVQERQPEPEPELHIKTEPEPQTLMPEIAINGGDVDMVDIPMWSTPPPSSIASNHTTPNHTPDPRPAQTPYMTTPSPRPSEGGSNQPDSSPRVFKCDECDREFDQYHKLNHHTRYHDRPHLCTHPGCGKRFGTKTHLDRHVNDKHTKTRKYFCTQYNCPYSRQGGKSFPRKDNWRRHMQNKHNIANPPEPAVEYCDEVLMAEADQGLSAF